ncbi:MAG: metallophosphoesterase [Bacteroidaceae bacterium]|nr:metallophosphoesterase [Bacteroidaceae bacterium]
MTKYSILHISDLHKLPGTTYEALLQSLLTDRDRYLQSGVAAPRYVVVSGDLIHGGDTEGEIEAQYAEVKGFLNAVATEFLGGDKLRMLIVPGNHDVSFPHSRSSMTPEADAHKKENSKLFWNGDASLRWDWREMEFYRIADPIRHAQRYELFRAFYDDFYEGNRTYPENPQLASECYSFYPDKVTFALFNSCRGLDHLNETADVDEEAIVNVTPNLRSSYNKGYLNIAVWHHHFYGAPRETNYLDREVIKRMSHSYIQMGLFGHQHVSQIAEFYGGDLMLSEAADNQRLLLVSSGTLFGGKKELGDGAKRQYNVIEVEQENGRANITIHVREDGNRNVESKLPIWTAKDSAPIRTSVQTRNLTASEQLANEQRTAQETGDYIAAFEHLKDISVTGTLYDRVRSELIRGIKNNRYLLDHLVPQTQNDYMLLMSCAERENDEMAKARLKADERLQAMLEDPIMKEMYERL